MSKVTFEAPRLIINFHGLVNKISHKRGFFLLKLKSNYMDWIGYIIAFVAGFFTCIAVAVILIMLHQPKTPKFEGI